MNLISKKDLLAITGISYGQLYRWKRERLIPEEWFIKQSAYTGQETFFPREQILSRINSILDLKDLYSLEELAKLLSPETTAAVINQEDLNQVEELDKALLEFMPEAFGKKNYEFLEIALSVAISQASARIDLSEDQRKELLVKSITAASRQRASDVCCTIFCSEEKYHTVFSSNQVSLNFDNTIDVRDQFSLSEITDKIKLKYKSLFIK